jgi:acetyl-CoA carboxylase biotin carboxylase subunit
MTLRRVLIANRSEIAIRIARACRESGIESVAVYSDADRNAPHVGAADLAVAIGPAAASHSYLSIPAILAAARSTGADAVHPGYGFLSENAAFARACQDAGLVFIGPPADVIERMGSKVAARALMSRAGVAVVPGETPVDQSDRGVLAAATKVGFPVLVKASAGGGGKGMRVLHDPASATPLIAAARREAAAAFGDGTLYVERLLERPRHVEIQVFGDTQGHVVHLFERECSIQRRHQKVIEESPSTALTPPLRAAMGDAAVAAARAAQYVNAGTIEFLLEGSGDEARFYFLEMNTRLQVEHAVTEAITGVDLVRAQFTVAAGGELPWSQSDLSQRGHAIECRIYAEDPANGFLPQAGTLLLYQEPDGPGVRIDSGVVEGASVSVSYDPLLAKVTSVAESRPAAIARAVSALRAFPILGIRTNLPFLIRVLEHPDFAAGDLHTGFIADHADTLLTRGEIPREALAAVSAAGLKAGTTDPASSDPWTTIKGWGRDDSSEAPNVQRIAPGLVRVGEGTGRLAWVAAAGDVRWVYLDGEVYEIERGSAGARRRAGSAHTSLTAPMPATVVRVDASPGMTVRRGDTLIILEAMKMELPIRAASDGVVKAVRCTPGDLVQPGVPLVDFE